MKKKNGFSLVESLLVIVIVASIVFLLANLPNAMNLINKSRHLSLAREIAAKQIEDKRATSYGNLVPDPSPVPISDVRISLLPKGSGSVLVENCDSAICTSGEDVKQITVSINWVDSGKNQSVFLKTFIGKGGLNQ